MQSIFDEDQKPRQVADVSRIDWGTVGKDATSTQEPYNRTLISDDLRHQLGVPSQIDQQKQLEMYQSANKRK